jgi:2'-5' RNA ligase
MSGMLTIGAMVCALVLSGGRAQAQQASPPVDQTPVTAIDIALEPDATMIQHAEAVNARLRKAYPKGFALDASHHPHITMVQRYVRTADLEKVYAAAREVFGGVNVTKLKLKAFRYYFIPDEPLGLSGIVIEASPELIELQRDLIDAVAPYTEKTGTAAAFVTTPESPDVNELTIHYVAVFVPEHSGKHFMPHVTTGLAPIEYLNGMLAEPFEAFSFSAVGASVYHLGNFGTARAKLKALDSMP